MKCQQNNWTGRIDKLFHGELVGAEADDAIHEIDMRVARAGGRLPIQDGPAQLEHLRDMRRTAHALEDQRGLFPRRKNNVDANDARLLVEAGAADPRLLQVDQSLCCRNLASFGASIAGKLPGSSSGSLIQKCPAPGRITVRTKNPACFSARRNASVWVRRSTMSSSGPDASRQGTLLRSSVAEGSGEASKK